MAKTKRNSPVDSSFAVAWRVLAWVLPGACVLGYTFLGASGWEALFMVFALPVAIPVLGLLTVTPLMILRRKNYESVPTPLAAIMVVHWVAFTLIFFGLGRVGDSSTSPSFIRKVIPYLLSYGEMTWQGLTVLLAFLSLVAAIIYAASCKKQTDADSEVNAGISLKSAPLVITGVATMAFILLGSCAATLLFANGSYDAAGDREISIMFLPENKMMELQEQKYDALQQKVSPIRQHIGEDNWLPTTVSGVSRGTNLNGLKRYEVYAGWQRDYSIPVSELSARTIEQFEELGWVVEDVYEQRKEYWVELSEQVTSQPSTSQPSTSRLIVSIVEIPEIADSSRLTIMLYEGRYFTSVAGADWHKLRGEVDDLDRWEDPTWLFKYDEWPSLASAENSPVTAKFRDDKSPAVLNE